jgi:hypothetical protein
MLVFKKQVDNLKTNHRGVYVLTDNAFRPLSRMSTAAGGQAVVRAQPVSVFFSFFFSSGSFLLLRLCGVLAIYSPSCSSIYPR